MKMHGGLNTAILASVHFNFIKIGLGMEWNTKHDATMCVCVIGWRWKRVSEGPASRNPKDGGGEMVNGWVSLGPKTLLIPPNEQC